MADENQQNYIFTTEAMGNFAGFHNALKRVSDRLISEGYVLENGKIIHKNDKSRSSKSPPALSK